LIIEFLITSPLEVHKVAFFKVMGKNGTYDIKIDIINGKPEYAPSDCTCPWGSFGSQTKKNMELNKCCRHLKECLDFLKKECWIEDDK